MASGKSSIASGDVRRVIAVTACCLVAALIPFYAGAPAAVLGLVPLAVAIWLVSRSGWSSHTRVTASVTVLVATIALVIGLLALSALTSHYN